MGETLKKFGRYFLLDHIAQGGMAEIFRARLASVDGAARLIVIKRIQSGYGTNSDFLRMFKSEIKVTMSLNHPNIVQVYDFGEEQSQPYIAMEFVDGKSLRQFLARISEIKQIFPAELSSFIIGQVAQGLGYAHAFKDKLTGQHFNIVHRDISPQNILISYDGAVKIIDFGIAKVATSGSDLTRAGVIKGKPSYLSPEQINGEPLDGRSDIFGLGIVFWELLTGKKLFAGENDLAVLKLIENCSTHVKAPSTLNPEIPKELDYIVLKALAKSADKRFQTAEEMYRVLNKFILSRNPDFDQKDLSHFTKNIFKNEIVEDRKIIQRLNDRAQKLLEVEVSSKELSKEVQPAKIKRDETSTAIEQQTKVTSLRTLESSDAGKLKVEIENTSIFKTPESQRDPISIRMDRREGSWTSSAPKQKPILQNKSHSVGRFGRFFLGLVVVVGIAYFTLLGPEEIPRLKNVLNPPIAQPQATEAPREPAAMAPKNTEISMHLILRPWTKGAKVLLNGKPLENSQFQAFPIQLDAPHELLVELPGFKKHVKEFTVTTAESVGKKEYPIEIAPEPEIYGRLTLRTTPNADLIFINGEDWGKRTPVQDEKLPIGSYAIRAMNEILQMEKVFNVKITENKSVVIDERLEIKK